MQIKYYIDDGYAGSDSRPQYVSIDDMELEGLEDCEINDLIEECIREDLNNVIHTYWDEEVLEEAKDIRDRVNEEVNEEEEE